MSRGAFVTFEGGEGVGKSSQLRLLKAHFAENGIDAVFTREPGGTDIGEKIRGIILDGHNGGMAPSAELLLYAAARAQHVQEVIRPAIEAGRLVICDRFTHSTLAYQGYARGLDIGAINMINAFSVGGVTPDLTVFLDVPPEEGFKRKGGKDVTDRLESEDMRFFHRVYEGFKSIDEPSFVRLDAGGAKLETHGKILKLLKEKGII